MMPCTSSTIAAAGVPPTACSCGKVRWYSAKHTPWLSGCCDRRVRAVTKCVIDWVRHAPNTTRTSSILFFLGNTVLLVRFAGGCTACAEGRRSQLVVAACLLKKGVVKLCLKIFKLKWAK